MTRSQRLPRIWLRSECSRLPGRGATAGSSAVFGSCLLRSRPCRLRYFTKRTRERRLLIWRRGRLAVLRGRTGRHAEFEFRDCMTFSDSDEQEVMTLRRVGIGNTTRLPQPQASPSSPVQWKLFNSKKKLSAHLRTNPVGRSTAAGRCMKTSVWSSAQNVA